MQEVFEKIIDKLEEQKVKGIYDSSSIIGEKNVWAEAIEIVKQEAEQYKDGWIPVEEELPETDKYILLSFSNFSIPCVGRYEEDENGGAFYVGDDDESCVSQDMFVNAWQTLPHPFQPKGE